MPSSCARSMIACASPGGVSDPKFIVPRQSRLTDRPLRPRCVYSMRLAFHGRFSLNRKLQAVLRGRARAEDTAVLLVDRDVVDAGLAAAHVPMRVELPQFVAIGPPPLPRCVVGLVLEADGDAVLRERPEVLAQRVIEFALPFLGQELDDLVPSGDEAVAVAPHRIDGIGGGDALGIAGVPRVLGGLNLPQRGLEGERGQRRAIGHRGLLEAALAGSWYHSSMSRAC